MSRPSVIREQGIACLTLGSPVLDTASLSHLRAAIEALSAENPAPPIVIKSDHPKIFLAGAHLAEIAALDETTCLAYARFGRAVLASLANHPAATVAAVDGACAGGGLDLVLACDDAVFGPSASCAHPGVKRGLVTGWGGTSSLPATIGRRHARKALLEGSSVDHETLREAGFTVLGSDDDLRATAIRQASRLSRLHLSRLALWRALKSGRFIDRFRISVILNEGTT